MKKDFTHLDQSDLPRMVNVSEKKISDRMAVAEALVRLGPKLSQMLQETGSTKKGPVIQMAIIAGIQGAKRTSELIPMCHPLPVSSVDVTIQIEGNLARIHAKVSTTDRTGVEMEALTGASVAALTIYDMCKSVTKSMVIESIRLLKKTGGESGDYSAI